MTSIEKLRAAFDFKRIPLEVGDDGAAFIGFVSFASGETNAGQSLQAEHFQATAGQPIDDTNKQIGQFIDWLIETQWGEAPAATTDVAVYVTPVELIPNTGNEGGAAGVAPVIDQDDIDRWSAAVDARRADEKVSAGFEKSCGGVVHV